MRYYHILPALAFVILYNIADGQPGRMKIKFGDVKPQDFALKAYSVDSSASAIYLFDGGSSKFEGNNHGFFNVVYAHHARIRLLNKKGFDLATVEIPLYVSNGVEQTLANVDAATYNLDDGKVSVTKVDKSALFKDKSGDFVTVKFTFPNLQEGSIIEYAYTVSSPGYYYIQPWYFQKEYPRLWSEYELTVPAFYDYAIIQQGYHPYVIDTGKISHDSYAILNSGGTEASQMYYVSANTINHVWAMKDVPALKEENYITTLSNYVSKIGFQLSAIRYPDEPVKQVMNNWSTEAVDLLKDDDFGNDLSKNNNWMEDDLKQITAGAPDQMSKAKLIYEYVRDNFTCTDYDSRWLSQPIKKSVSSKKRKCRRHKFIINWYVCKPWIYCKPCFIKHT